MHLQFWYDLYCRYRYYVISFQLHGITNVNAQDNINLVKSCFGAFGEGYPPDFRNALMKYLADEFSYGQRFNSRHGFLQWLLGSNSCDDRTPQASQFWPGDHEETAIARIFTELKGIWSSGNVVFLERTDQHFDTNGNNVITLQIASVIEISNGKIVSWRDYQAYEP